MNETCEMSEAVQVQPEYWPDNLDLPWVRIDDVINDGRLRRIVISEDKGLLDAEEGQS